MDYRKFGSTWMLRIDAGEEIVESLKAMCAREGIRLAQVSAIGAADKASVREDLEGFMEIANLSGSVTEMNGEPYIHLHAALADQRNAVHGGHVISMRVGATCEMFVQALEGSVTRVKDEGLGINLWTF